MGRLQTDQVFRLKDREGFLLNFTFGKTIRAGLSRPFTLLRIPNVPVCPVLWLNCYIAARKALGVPLIGEYLFRSSAHKKAVSHRPLGDSAVSARLHKYLSTEMALLYTRRSGASVSLDLLERITLGLASVSSKASPSLADQRNLQKISC